MNAVIFSNFALNIVMSSSLNMLWGLINTLQLIAHMPMFAINFPANAKLLFLLINQVSTFDILPVEDIQNGMFNFDQIEETPFNDNFDEMDIF